MYTSATKFQFEKFAQVLIQNKNFIVFKDITTHEIQTAFFINKSHNILLYPVLFMEYVLLSATFYVNLNTFSY